MHIGAPVKRLNVVNNKANGFVASVDGGPDRGYEYDAVIATTPSYIFTRLAPDLPDDYRAVLESARYLSAVLVILVLDRPLTSKYWLNVADRSLPFVGVIEHTNMIDRGLYGGNHVVYLTNYPDRNSELYRKEPEELLEEYVPHLRKLNPDFSRGLDTGIPPPPGGRGAADHTASTTASGTSPTTGTPIGSLYLANTDADLPRGPGHELLRAHGSPGGASGIGGRIGSTGRRLIRLRPAHPVGVPPELGG